MTAKVLSDETIRRRTVRVKMEWADIHRLIASRAMIDAELVGAPGINGVEAEVKITQREEGSPSYRVSKWDAVVEIVLPVA